MNKKEVERLERLAVRAADRAKAARRAFQDKCKHKLKAYYGYAGTEYQCLKCGKWE